MNYTPCDEQEFADFDLQEAYADGVKLNEVAFLGTHNSYQLLATFPRRAYDKLCQIIPTGKKGDKLDFEMDTLTVQLENGVRSLEIDIETVDDGKSVSFIVTHDPILDNVSSCYDFAKALEEIKLWSDNNPNHLPITILIEPKAEVTETLIPVVSKSIGTRFMASNPRIWILGCSILNNCPAQTSFLDATYFFITKLPSNFYT